MKNVWITGDNGREFRGTEVSRYAAGSRRFVRVRDRFGYEFTVSASDVRGA